MKRLALILLGIFVLTLFSVLPAEASGGGNQGTVWRDTDTGAFDSIKWTIEATGATKDVRYRVVERTVTIMGHTATFPANLANPAPGETKSNIFKVTAEDLAREMNMLPGHVEDMMNSGAVATMSAKVEIYDAGKTKDPVKGTYTTYTTLHDAMVAEGFDEQSKKDIETLWGIADD